MARLSTSEKIKLEKLFDMASGYVIDFSNRTFSEFFKDNFGIDIYQSKYDYSSGSKANRLRAFWQKEEDAIVGNLLLQLLEYWKLQKELSNTLITLSEKTLYEDCISIAERLTLNKASSKSI